MAVKLNRRGNIFLSIIIVLIAFANYIGNPTLILFTTMAIAYIISYPYYMRKYTNIDVEFNAIPRHGIMYRGEIDILLIEITNKSKFPIPMAKLTINLSPTVYVVNQPSEYVVTLKSNSKIRISLPILPTSRGSHVIGPLILSYGDPFLLYEQEIAKIDSVVIRVYPKRLGYNVSNLKRQQVFNKLIGLFATHHKGIGTEFHALRDYVRGDSTKIIDWAASARKSKLISKEFEDERKLEVIIALAAGTTARGAKFDFMLGVAMDIFEGIQSVNHPVGMVIFDENIIKDFKPSSSKRQKMKIWSSVYDLMSKDVYANYYVLSNWVVKKGITRNLIIILGDTDYKIDVIQNVIRELQLRNNYVIFIDIWGYRFSYYDEITASARDLGYDEYGRILSEVISPKIEQGSILSGLALKSNIHKYNAIYGYIQFPSDNIIDALDNALRSHFGTKWS